MPRDGDSRYEECLRCGRVTYQEYWSHRDGWICHDHGEGCGLRVLTPEEWEREQAKTLDVTADDIWGPKG